MPDFVLADEVTHARGRLTTGHIFFSVFAQKQIAALPTSTHAAFKPANGARWRAISEAHDAIGPMFWGERTTLEAARAEVRAWLAAELG